MSRKRLIIIIIITIAVLFLGLVAYLIYSFFSTSVTPPPSQPSVSTTPTPSPQVPSNLPSKISLVSQYPAINYNILSSGNIIYVDASGTIREINQNQESILYSASSSIIDAKISSDGQEVIIKTAPYSYLLINTSSTTVTPLNALGRIESLAFSPTTSTQIAILKNNGASSELDVINFSSKTTKITQIASFAEQDYRVYWPYQNTIYLVQKPSVWAWGSALSFNTVNKTVNIFAANIPGLILKFLPNNQVLEFSANLPTARGGFLNLFSQTGQKINSFSFLTLPSKCTFNQNSSSTLFCAIPRGNDFAKAVLPDSYLMKALYTTDDVEAINLKDGNFHIIFNDPLEYYDMNDLQFFGGNIYFINRYDQKIYKLAL